MYQVVTAVVALIAQIAPAVSTAGTIAKIISSLVALLPALVKFAQDLIPTVKGIIATLKGADGVTPEQLKELDDIEAKIDADYDEAAAKAAAEDQLAEDAALGKV